MNDPLEGNFEGIGIEFRIQDDTVVVVQPIGGGPSERLGIRAGDRIVKVDSSLIAGIGINNSQVVKKLKGPIGTTVDIEILRKGSKELIDFSIKRDKIPFYSLEANYMLNDSIAYIKVSRFAKTTYSEFMEAIDELRVKGMKKLILMMFYKSLF